MSTRALETDLSFGKETFPWVRVFCLFALLCFFVFLRHGFSVDLGPVPELALVDQIGLGFTEIILPLCLKCWHASPLPSLWGRFKPCPHSQFLLEESRFLSSHEGLFTEEEHLGGPWGLAQGGWD